MQIDAVGVEVAVDSNLLWWFRGVVFSAAEDCFDYAALGHAGIRPGRDVVQEEIVEDGPDRYDGGELADIAPGGGERGFQDTGADQKSERPGVSTSARYILRALIMPIERTTIASN